MFPPCQPSWVLRGAGNCCYFGWECNPLYPFLDSWCGHLGSALPRVPYPVWDSSGCWPWWVSCACPTPELWMNPKALSLALEGAQWGSEAAVSTRKLCPLLPALPTSSPICTLRVPVWFPQILLLIFSGAQGPVQWQEPLRRAGFCRIGRQPPPVDSTLWVLWPWHCHPGATSLAP